MGRSKSSVSLLRKYFSVHSWQWAAATGNSSTSKFKMKSDPQRFGPKIDNKILKQRCTLWHPWTRTKDREGAPEERAADTGQAHTLYCHRSRQNTEFTYIWSNRKKTAVVFLCKVLHSPLCIRNAWQPERILLWLDTSCDRFCLRFLKDNGLILIKAL